MDRMLMLAGSLFYGITFMAAAYGYRRARPLPSVLILSSLAIGFTVQFGGMYLRGLDTHGCPIGNPFEILQFITWCLILIYLVVGSTFRQGPLGFFVSALAALLGLVSFLIPHGDQAYTGSLFGGNPWIEMHASLALLSYGFFGLLALTAIMYLLQYNSLRRKQTQVFFRFLPSLYELEKINRRLLLWGNVFFISSLAIGAFYWIPHPETVSLIKLSATLALGLFYALTAILSYSRKIHTRTTARCCLLLFLAAMIALGTLANEAAAPTAPTPTTSDRE